MTLYQTPCNSQFFNKKTILVHKLLRNFHNNVTEAEEQYYHIALHPIYCISFQIPISETFNYKSINITVY